MKYIRRKLRLFAFHLCQKPFWRFKELHEGSDNSIGNIKRNATRTYSVILPIGNFVDHFLAFDLLLERYFGTMKLKAFLGLSFNWFSASLTKPTINNNNPLVGTENGCRHLRLTIFFSPDNTQPVFKHFKKIWVLLMIKKKLTNQRWLCFTPGSFPVHILIWNSLEIISKTLTWDPSEKERIFFFSEEVGNSVRCENECAIPKNVLERKLEYSRSSHECTRTILARKLFWFRIHATIAPTNPGTKWYSPTNGIIAISRWGILHGIIVETKTTQLNDR